MQAETGVIGPANSWYLSGFNNLIEISIQNIKIYILSVPYFIASKFEAFHNRRRDYRPSHDFEDIVYVLNNRINIVNEILDADEEVKTFLKVEFSKILDSPYTEKFVILHIERILMKEDFLLFLKK